MGTVEVEESVGGAEEKTAVPLELFFDLVFVFAITQVVYLIVHDLSFTGLGHGALVLGMLWWGWSNWTWSTNAVDLDPRAHRVVVLAGMFGVFVLAHAVPDTFHGGEIWVASGYLYMRLFAALLMYLGARGDEAALGAFFNYMPLAMVAPIVMLVIALVGWSVAWLWFGAFAIELIAAARAGRSDWEVDAGHFAERHGLILIIALGEAIIAVGAALGDFDPSWKVLSYLVIGLAGACVMFWAYFDRLEEVWEETLRQADAHETGLLARDAYSVLHYPMILGIVLSAVALEEAFLHPTDPLETIPRLALVLGPVLFLMGVAAATYRAVRVILWERIVGLSLIAVVVFAGTAIDAIWLVVFVTVAMVVMMTAEYLRFSSRVRIES